MNIPPFIFGGISRRDRRSTRNGNVLIRSSAALNRLQRALIVIRNDIPKTALICFTIYLADRPDSKEGEWERKLWIH